MTKILGILKEPSSLLGILGGLIGVKETGVLSDFESLAPLFTGASGGWLMIGLALFAIINREGNKRG
jgi:hypothetical protein|tara:strand:+ start:5945 stop:6145 length:201 start_codon:yes stop_codon:yes gene_type:complete